MDLNFIVSLDDSLKVLRNSEFESLGLMVSAAEKNILTFVEKKRIFR